MNYVVIPAYQPDNKLIKLVEKIHDKSDFKSLLSMMEAHQPVKKFLIKHPNMQQFFDMKSIKGKVMH